jgi:hypothetical protein
VIDIDSGYHINSNRPLDKFLVATALKVEPEAGFAGPPRPLSKGEDAEVQLF